MNRVTDVSRRKLLTQESALWELAARKRPQLFTLYHCSWKSGADLPSCRTFGHRWGGLVPIPVPALVKVSNLGHVLRIPPLA
ncbi:unnamed protein product [Nezara viridula]|uniref:Uncharacterized protein n=1 Tax=Nezara viridula TaxID=85310 RepID=A0A9P0DXV3_NEZVI|nr:unnamed protein product [Nezara viridula]